MKIIWKKIAKDRSGTVKLECEDPEDFWHIYNLLRLGDILSSLTFRKVQHVSSTGTVKNNKVKCKISLEIDKIEYDTNNNKIRVKGVNCKENKYISLGQSHTLELDLNRPFEIYKKEWDSIDLNRINTACDYTKSADLCIIPMQLGLSHILLVTSHMTITISKITKSIPGKRLGSSTRHDKAIEKFYSQILTSIMRHVNFDVVKCIVLASPGFIKDDFMEYMWKQCQSDSNKYRILLDNKSKFITAHASGGHRGVVKEILSDENMKKLLEDTKASNEVKLLDDFFKLLNKDETKAIYGYKHVLEANKYKAIEKLLVTDKLFRSKDIKTRKLYVKLIEDIEKNGAEIIHFSSRHVTGEQLDQITGIAAFLRVSLPQLLELGDDDNNNDSSSDDDEEDDDDNSGFDDLMDDEDEQKN